MENNHIYEIINLDDKLRKELVSAYLQAEVTNPWDGLLEDGTAKPPPAPEAVKSLDATDERRRAGALWYHVFRLECLISQWYEWLLLAPLVGQADPALAYNLATGVKDCVRFLCCLGLFKEPEAQVVEAFPDPEQAPIGIRWYFWPEGRSGCISQSNGCAAFSRSVSNFGDAFGSWKPNRKRSCSSDCDCFPLSHPKVLYPRTSNRRPRQSPHL